MTELEETVRDLEARIAAIAVSDRDTLAVLLARLGSNLEGLGQRERALEVLHAALRVFEELGDAKGTTDTLNRMSAVLISVHRFDDARALLGRGLNSARLTVRWRHLYSGDMSQQPRDDRRDAWRSRSRM